MNASDGGNGMSVLLLAVVIAVILMNVGLWKTLEKAGLSGGEALIPIQGLRAMIRMAGLENWKIPRIALVFGPFLLWRVPFGIARQFGKGHLFGLGLLLLPFVFFPILGFGKARYKGEPAPQAPEK